MAKKVIGKISLLVSSGKANPSPPIGPALGQRGLNIMEFCKAFNAQTQSMVPGIPLPVIITYYSDKSFTFVIKQPPVSYLIKEAAGIKSGSKETGKGSVVGKITEAQVKEIANRKLVDMNAFDIDAAISMVKGTASSMGIEVVEGWCDGRNK